MYSHGIRLVMWKKGGIVYPGVHAKERPDKIAHLIAETGESITYRELNDGSNQLAQLFWDKGLRPGDHVSLFMENHLRYWDVYWAVIRSGLYLTTVNKYLTTDEAAYIIHDSESKALVTSFALRDQAAGLIGNIPNCTVLLMMDGITKGFENYEEATGQYSAAPLAEEILGDTMLYSSGTTGRPKGIKRPHGEKKITDGYNLATQLLTELFSIGEDAVLLQPAPFYHSAPTAFSTSAQAVGGTVVSMQKFEPEAALRSIETYQCNHGLWVPTMFVRMLKLPPETREKYDVSTIKVAVHGAAPCPVQVKKEMINWWGPVLREYYAGTELNGFVFNTSEEWLAHPGTVGKPILGNIRICDEEGEEVPLTEIGTIYFELPEMPFEYHNSPEKTKDAQHPAHPNWSTLGDIGYLDNEGYLYLTDRKSFMIVSGGVNIYPAETENILVMHPKVADVAVFGVPNRDFGEEVKAVVETIEGVGHSKKLATELLEYCREHLAHYKCPRSIDFAEELPRLPTGKLYKRLVRDKYWGKHKTRIV